MNYIKRRIALLLSILMVFTTVFVVAPENVQAANASYSLSGSFLGPNSKAVVYKGIKDFYIGDFISVLKAEVPGSYYTSLGTLSSQKNVSYTSSKTKVAKIDKKTGKVTTKDTGTTTITIKFNGVKTKVSLKVVSKSSFDKKLSSTYYGTTAKTTEKNAKAFLEKVGKNPKITSENRYTMLNAYNSYTTNTGYASFGNYNQSTGAYTSECYIYSPSAVRASNAKSAIGAYCNQYDPFSTRSGKCFEISSIKGKAGTKKIEITLKKSVTEDQIFGGQAQFDWDSNVKKTSTYTFPIIVKDTADGHEYYAIATVKKNKKTMTIELKNHKLVKNKKYQLVPKTSVRNGYYVGSWLDGSLNKESKFTFKAKK